jgi:malate dehydrogenase (oxaloacetate-decarboxylating)
VLAGVLAGIRDLGRPLRGERIVLVGAGAAGIGIARLLRLAMAADGATQAELASAVVLVDSRGLVHAARDDLDADKRALALPADAAVAAGFELGGTPPQLVDVVERVQPTVLAGVTGVAGSFSEAAIRAMAAACDRPIVMPLSNPTAIAEAPPEEILAWTDGRARIATGSPFAPVSHRGARHEIGQANNVFIFPGLGLGTIVSEARTVSDQMVLAAARTLASLVPSGALYPPIGALREVSRAVALAVAREATSSGLAEAAETDTLEADVDAAMWWPAYVPYLPA